MSLFEWWDSLSLAIQIFYCIAIPSTLVLVIQTVLMLLGIGDSAEGDLDVDGGLEADLPDGEAGDGIFGDEVADVSEATELSDVSDAESLNIFTMRGIIAFLVVFGWVGVVMLASNMALPITIAVAGVCAFIVMVAIAYLFKSVMKLKSNGAIDNRNALGAAGRVYLTVPPSRSGEGKVNVILQGKYVERNAVTDETEAIPTGCEIIVVGLSGQTNLVVKRK